MYVARFPKLMEKEGPTLQLCFGVVVITCQVKGEDIRYMDLSIRGLLCAGTQILNVVGLNEQRLLFKL